MKVREALCQEAERILGVDRGRAFVAELDANLLYCGLLMPAPLSVHFSAHSDPALARERLDRLAAAARHLADTLGLFAGYPVGGSDGLAWGYLRDQRERLDGAHLERLAREIADVGTAAAQASAQIRIRRGAPANPRRRLAMQFIVAAYRATTGKRPRAAEKFQDLVAAVLADREIPIPRDLKSFIAEALKPGE